MSVLFLISISSPITFSKSRNDAETDYVQYVIVKELNGTVRDEETGDLVDNVRIEGEIHSMTLDFLVEITGGTYSYSIWDTNHELLRSNSGLELVGERFVLPVSNLLESGEHEYTATASAPGYSSQSLSGAFIAGERERMDFELDRERPEPPDQDYKPPEYDYEEPDLEDFYQDPEFTKTGGSEDYTTTTQYLQHWEEVTRSQTYETRSQAESARQEYGGEISEVEETEWVAGHWTWKTVPDYEWREVPFLLYLFWPGQKTTERVQTKIDTDYKYNYTEYHRDWHWWPPGWGSWHYHSSGSKAFESYKGSSFTKGGNFWQGWKKVYNYAESVSEYGWRTTYKIKLITGHHQEHDEWILGHEETYTNYKLEWEESNWANVRVATSGDQELAANSNDYKISSRTISRSYDFSKVTNASNTKLFANLTRLGDEKILEALASVSWSHDSGPESLGSRFRSDVKNLVAQSMPLQLDETVVRFLSDTGSTSSESELRSGLKSYVYAKFTYILADCYEEDTQTGEAFNEAWDIIKGVAGGRTGMIEYIVSKLIGYENPVDEFEDIIFEEIGTLYFSETLNRTTWNYICEWDSNDNPQGVNDLLNKYVSHYTDWQKEANSNVF